MRWLPLLALIITFTGCTMKTQTPAPETNDFIASNWNFQDPAGTEQAFADWLNNTDAPLVDRLLVRTQVARTHSLRGNFDQAHTILDDVEAEMTDAMPDVQMRYLLERGRTYNSAGEPEKAVPLFTRAWEQGNETGNEKLAVDAAHMLGIASATPEEQLQWNLRTLEIIESSANPALKGWRGPLYNNIGWTYHDMGEFKTALGYFTKDSNWRKEIGDVNGGRISRWSVARCLRSLERYDEALQAQQELEREYLAAELPVGGYVLEELGELHLAMGHPQQARPYFAQAHEILSNDSWLVQNEPDRLARLKKLSQE